MEVKLSKMMSSRPTHSQEKDATEKIAGFVQQQRRLGHVGQPILDIPLAAIEIHVSTQTKKVTPNQWLCITGSHQGRATLGQRVT